MRFSQIVDGLLLSVGVAITTFAVVCLLLDPVGSWHAFMSYGYN